MRRQTQWALGGALAGTVLLGVGTTLAVFTDVASTSGTAGAASLALQVTPAPVPGQPLEVHAGDGDGVTLMAAHSGGVAARLDLSLAGADCAQLPTAWLEVAVPGMPVVTRDLCGLATAPVLLRSLDATASTVPVTVRVLDGSPSGSPTGPAPQGVDWTGDLRIGLVQDTGARTGLSDARTLRVHLVVPAPQPAGPEPRPEEVPQPDARADVPQPDARADVPQAEAQDDVPESSPDGGSTGPQPAGDPEVQSSQPA